MYLKTRIPHNIYNEMQILSSIIEVLSTPYQDSQRQNQIKILLLISLMIRKGCQEPTSITAL